MRIAHISAAWLGGLTIGLVLLVSCARVAAPRLQFPEGQLQITAHSSRPATATPIEAQRMPSRSEVNLSALNLPMPGLQAALTPIHVTAEARVPSALLDARLAAIIAREQVRLDSLTSGLEQMNRWRESGLLTAGVASPAMEFNQVANALRLRREGDLFTAEILWTPPLSLRTGDSQVTDGQSASMLPAMGYHPLSPQVRREMEIEARERAVSSLRRILERTEVSPGETLGQWMVSNGISPDSLDAALDRGSETETEFDLDPTSGIHTCSVHLLFDYQELNRLR